MPRSRVQQRLNTCSSLLIAFILALIALALFLINARQPEVAQAPTPIPTPTFISRDALPLAPTPTLPFTLPELPTFTPTPTASPTPTITPTPT
ncbi:MAG TPA: hypothetical protein G4O05_03240, partial [Caldilineae bacterium]|nr:hypothetical protein [Caldilineae bacterium]